MSDLDRFLEKVAVDRADQCWLWTGCANAEGYGRFVLRGRVENAHRAAWLMQRGLIERGLVVRHKCDNPKCVNLNHLEIGTHADNAADKVRRKRTKRLVSPEAVLAIRAAQGTYRTIGERFGVSASYVCIIKNKTGIYRHVS